MTFTRIAVIYNPRSGQRREREDAVERFAAMLREAGMEVYIYPTEHRGHATELASAAVAQGCDLVLAHGGDGTMNEVLQALVGTSAVLGFWPGGTANVLAAELGFPTLLEAVVARVLAGNVAEVTVGRANNRYFLLMAGIGIDAAIAASVDPVWKQRLGKGAFGVSALKIIRRWQLPSFRVQLDGEELEGRFLVAGNGRKYGGGLHVTPLADLTEPVLDLCLFSKAERFSYIRFGLAAIFGRHLKLPGVTYRKVKEARISGPDVPVQLDGEAVGTLPLTLEAIPAGLRLLC